MLLYSNCIICSQQQCTRIPNSPRLRQHLLFSGFPVLVWGDFFFGNTILMGVKRYLIVVLICISLIITDVEHLFMCLMAMCPSLSPLHSCCSATKSCCTLCDPMDCSTPGFPVLHSLLKFAQIHVRWVVMLSNHLILCSPFPFVFNLSWRREWQTTPAFLPPSPTIPLPPPHQDRKITSS